MPRRNFEQREYLTPNEAHVLFPDEAATFRSLFAAGKVAGFQRSTGKRTRLYLRAESIRDYYRRLEAETADALYEAEKSKPFRYADHPKIQAYRAAQAAAGAAEKEREQSADCADERRLKFKS